MNLDRLSADTQVTLMLVSSLGQPRGTDLPLLRQSEIATLVTALTSNHLTPSDLLDTSNVERLDDLGIAGITGERVSLLLERGVALTMAVEKWTNSGIWILSWSDSEYPKRYRERLKGQAPSVLYGVGDADALSNGGLAVVGSRRIDEAAIEFSQRIGALSAREGMQVISGGAKGADSQAMSACAERGGHAVGVLADSLARTSVSGDYRRFIAEGNVTLISPFEPEAGFSVGTAMARNKLIYALSDYALVVSSDYEKGGTWAGATENLNKGWVPLFVRSDPGVPEGNERLLKLGGIPLDGSILTDDIALTEWLSENAARVTANSSAQAEQLSMF